MQKVQAARLKLIARYPYYAAALMRMPLVESRECPVMGVDAGWQCYVNPDWVAEHSVDEIAAVLLHELQHCLRAHYKRTGIRQIDIWNKATDCEINDDLVTDGYPIRQLGGIYPAMFEMPDGMLAEEYYDLLVNNQSFQQAGRNNGSSASKQSGNHGQPDDLSGELADLSGQGCSLSSVSAGDDNHTAGLGGRSSPQDAFDSTDSADDTDTFDNFDVNLYSSFGGSCADGVQRPWEQDINNDAVSDGEAEVLRRITAERIKNAGTVPAGIRRWAEQLLEPPKVNWQRALHAAINRAVQRGTGCVDYSYTRPNRRYRGEVIMPRLVAPKPEIAVLVDTSGSITDNTLATILCEVRAIVRVIQRDCIVVCADTRIHTVQRVWDTKQIIVRGGGGTDMGYALHELIARVKPRPQIVVVLTDGYTPWCKEPPAGVNIVVALIGNGANAKTVPDWARVIEVE